MEYARTPKEEAKPIIVQNQVPHRYKYSLSYGPMETKRGKVHFSNKERMHLTIAALLVIGVGLSFGVFSNYSVSYALLIAFAMILTASFLLHEIAHKIAAQREGLWAEFRLTLIGAIITLISILTPFFKIISPGAVMIAGIGDRSYAGKVSIAGPATNMALSMTFLALTFTFPQYAALFALAAFFNAWMAVFNLIPIGILDGFKVFTWDKKNWALAFVVSVILLILSYQLSNVYPF
jgi:Zn-dependent protease